MKKKHIDVQSYFQDWAQAKRKEVQDMEKSMRENPLYQNTSQKEGSAGYGKVHEGKSVISERS